VWHNSTLISWGVEALAEEKEEIGWNQIQSTLAIKYIWEW